MKTKIRNLLAFVLLWAASLAILFGSPSSQLSGNPQTEPNVSVPGMVSSGRDSAGMRTRADSDLPSARYGAHIDPNQPSVTLEQLDALSLSLKPNQIGINRSVAISPNTRAQKFVNPDGSQLIVLTIKSSGASGIGVHFRNFALADGEEVYVYGTATDSIVFGPFTDKGPWGSGEFWSGTVDGDTIVIELYKRTEENGQGFEIYEVSHILADLDWRLRSNEPEVLNCEVDASCSGGSEKNSVGRIIYNDVGVYVCTGTLLNNSAQDETPYFLTANHCVDTQAVAETVEVYWFYQTTSCNSGVLRTLVHSPPGAYLLATQVSNDFSLLRLQNNAPGGAFFSGWISVVQALGTNVFGLHHPDGYTPPSLNSYLRRSTGNITSTNENCVNLVNGYDVGWTSGTTEPGSSGSGLWNSNGYLVGVLSCGPRPATCNHPDAGFSKFANFYPQIRQYLSSPVPSAPIANPATFVASYSFSANWRSVSGATGYRLDVATNNSFTNYVTGYQNLNVGNGLSRSITGLSASTTYYYRVRAYNGNGTSSNSNVVSVTTLTPTGLPVVTTNPATFIASFSATLNGYLDPHGLTTTVSFQYGTTTAYGSTTPMQTQTGNTYRNIIANISALSPNTLYHFRIMATNSAGTRFGADRTFTTLSVTGPPVVTTNPATFIASFSATLNALLNPHGLPTSFHFQYGTTPSYGLTTAPQNRTGNTFQAVVSNITGLTANTLYHFRVVASNGAGTTTGSDRTFTTLTATGPPVVITNAATNVTTSSGTLNGSLDPHGLTTTVSFQYGTTTSYGSATPNQSQTGNTYRNIMANINGLTSHTTYHFRMVATNAGGTRYGGDRAFTTP